MTSEQRKGPPKSDGSWFQKGGDWHARGLQMYLEAGGRHGVGTAIAKACGVTTSTVAKTIKRKRWADLLVKQKKAEAAAIVGGDDSAAEDAEIALDTFTPSAMEEVVPDSDDDLDEHGELPAVRDDELDDPAVKARVRKSQRSVGLALLRKAVEALEFVEVKSAATVVKLVREGFDLLREAHGMNERREQVDVNVNLRALGQIINGAGEAMKQIPHTEVRQIEAWSPPPEPDWDEVDAIDAEVVEAPEAVDDGPEDDELTPEERAMIEELEAEWGAEDDV